MIWCVEDALGRSGGILTFWDDRKFSCLSAWSIGGCDCKRDLASDGGRCVYH